MERGERLGVLGPLGRVQSAVGAQLPGAQLLLSVTVVHSAGSWGRRGVQLSPAPTACPAGVHCRASSISPSCCPCTRLAVDQAFPRSHRTPASFQLRAGSLAGACLEVGSCYIETLAERSRPDCTPGRESQNLDGITCGISLFWSLREFPRRGCPPCVQLSRFVGFGRKFPEPGMATRTRTKATFPGWKLRANRLHT